MDGKGSFWYATYLVALAYQKPFTSTYHIHPTHEDLAGAFSFVVGKNKNKLILRREKV